MVPQDGGVDYLKIKVFLYKFTPEMKIASGARADYEPVLRKSTAAQSLVDQTSNLKKKLMGWQSILRGFDIGAAPAYNTIQGVVGVVNGLTSLDNIRGSNLLILQDSTKSPSASAELAGTSSAPAKIPMKFEVPGASSTGATFLPSFSSSLVVSKQGGTSSLLEQCDELVALLKFKSAADVADTDKKTVQTIVGNILSFLAAAIEKCSSKIFTGEAEKDKFQKDLQNIKTTVKQFTVSRFTYDLNPGDLSRFDLSKFVVGYRTDQMLGDISSCGSIGGAVSLQNIIVPLADLDKVPSTSSVRRPFYFPDDVGAYIGYTEKGTRVFNQNEQIPTADPITGERVSTLERDVLVTRLAMMQTLEDNGGSNVKKKGDPFLRDVQRLEIAMRLRGIKNTDKKELMVNFLRTGNADPALIKMVNKFNKKTITLADSREDLKLQLTQIKSMTDANEDGILISDLVQKYDFLSIFVYKHPVSPDLVEDVMLTVDPYVFDKESLFMYTPASFFTGTSEEVISDTRHFSTYVPEFNGFVAEVDNVSTPGSVNNINVNLMGSMGLMSATRRIYNSTIFQKSVYDAAETMGTDIISLYQNIYAGKTPLTILTTLLDSLYLLRTTQPKRIQELKVPDSFIQKEREKITRAAAASPGTFTQDKIDALVEKKRLAEEKRLKNEFVGGDDGDKRDFIRDNEGILTSYCDLLSLRAFNQYAETDSNGIAKGPMHMFNIPSYLYSNVMRSRRFNVKVPSKAAVDSLSSKPPFGYNPKTGAVSGAFDPWSTDEAKAVRTSLLKETDGSGGSVLEINPALDPGFGKDFKAYFKFLNDSLGTFVADLRTPFEIMNEVVKSCYLELYETPGGRFIFRTPQYNNNEPIYKTYRSGKDILTKTDETTLVTDANGEFKAKNVDKDAAGQANMITSEDIVPIATSYHQSAKNLTSKQSLGYGVDLINVPIEQLYYFYTNGKIVAQYGLLVGAPVVNPNVRFKSKITLESTDGEIDSASYSRGVFEYCRFFLEYSNLRNFSGNITAVGDPKIQVGRTYYDVTNQKFGYITRVSKELTVGQTYVVSFAVDAVRDAVYGEIASGEAITRPEFRLLPTLEDLVGRFDKAAKTVKARMPKQAAKQEATNIDFILPDRRRPYVDPKKPQQGVGVLTPLGRLQGLPLGVKGPGIIPVPFKIPGR